MNLHYFMRASPVNNLGPYLRSGIWVQGCNHQCHGCIVPESWDVNNGGEVISVEAMAEWILTQSDIEGITISGGEPFQQPKALCLLIDLIHQEIYN